MQRTIFAALVIGAALSISPGAMAQEPPRPPSLTVSAEGGESAPPDIATLSLGVTTFNADASAAMAENSERMATLVQALRRAGVAQRDIQTSRLNLQPRERSRSSSGAGYEEPVIVGYAASHQMHVQTRDMDGLPRLISTAVAAGGNRLHGVTFSIDDPRAQLDAARREAVAEARRRAELYADAAGLHVVRITRMSEGYNRVSGGDDEIIVTGYRANDASEMLATPIEIGQIQTRSVMTVVFELR